MNTDHHNYETLFLLNIYFKLDLILSWLENVSFNSSHWEQEELLGLLSKSAFYLKPCRVVYEQVWTALLSLSITDQVAGKVFFKHECIFLTDLVP